MRKKVASTVRRTVPAKADGLAPLIAEVRGLIQSARRGAASVVNTLQVMTNFENRPPHRGARAKGGEAGRIREEIAQRAFLATDGGV